MNRKLMILGLAAIAALAVAVPALAAGGTVEPTITQSLSIRALAKARLALLTARSAKSQSRVAVRTAGAAVNTANEAKKVAGEDKGGVGPAGPPGPPGPAASAVQSDVAAATVGTESETYVQLPGGPSVTVEVPSSGLIEVWAQVTIAEEGVVGLFQDGTLMPGQSKFCSPSGTERALLSLFGAPEATAVSTPSSIAAGGCGGDGPPAAVLFQTSPGPHTYELRYASCGCAPEAIFSQRRLFVAGRP